MQVDVQHRPVYAVARVRLEAGEQVKAEAGAMVAMSGDVAIQTGAAGGLGKALKRSLLGGESFWQNTFTAGPGGGSVDLAPPMPGDILPLQLQGHNLIVQDGSYLASATTVEVDTRWAGLKSWGLGEGFVLLHVGGHGMLLLNSYGAIDARTLAAGERLVVDTGHLVAYTEGIRFTVRRIGGLKSTLFSGEGVVGEFTGPGTVWTQSRSSQAFLTWLLPKMPGTGGAKAGRGGLDALLGG